MTLLCRLSVKCLFKCSCVKVRYPALPYRRDIPPNSTGQSHGSVLIAINSEFDSTEVNSLQTDCEIVWVELTIQNSRKLLLSSFYRPQPNDDVSLEKLNQSPRRLNPNSKSIVIVSGDFNLGHIGIT